MENKKSFSPSEQIRAKSYQHSSQRIQALARATTAFHAARNPIILNKTSRRRESGSDALELTASRPLRVNIRDNRSLARVRLAALPFRLRNAER